LLSAAPGYVIVVRDRPRSAKPPSMDTELVASKVNEEGHVIGVSFLGCPKD